MHCAAHGRIPKILKIRLFVMHADYRCLITAEAEAGLSDEDLYDHAKASDEELFPISVADRLLRGDNAVRVYRNYRGMTQKQLAKEASISETHLMQIERGWRTGSDRTLEALAKVLRVAANDLP